MPVSESAISQVNIKINGALVSPSFMRSLLEVEVDTNLHLPSMFTIRLLDNEATWADNETLISIGKPVEIAFTAATQGNRSGTTATLIVGEITAIEPYFGIAEAILTISGYCKSHRLHRGRFTRTFLNQTDSDIVKNLAQAKGLTSRVETTAGRHDYIIQYNQTDWEFLNERAARIGYRIFVEEQTLHFKKAANGTNNGPDLTWGMNLRTFRPRISAAQQAVAANVRSWNPKTKASVVSTSSAKELVPETGFSTTAVTSASVFGSADSTVINIPTSSQDYTNAIATAQANQRSSRAIQAEGDAFGDPALVAGNKVMVKGVGKRFGGKYTVTSATHTYDSENGYTTRFVISGTDSATIFSLMPGNDAAAQGREFGVVIGLVTNSNDPDKLGRVKLKFPWLSEELESEWARIAAPMAGSDRGFMYIPEINDEVLVAFEQGDPTRPYVLGALWNGRDKPPLNDATASGKTVKRIIKSTSGHQILFVDKAGEESIAIIDKTGKNSIKIDSVKGDIVFAAEGNITLEAKGKITLTSQMDAKIESKTGKVSISGVSGAELASNATAAVKGSVVQVQGSGPVTVKGNPIALN